jgi:hypothetical protein
VQSLAMSAKANDRILKVELKHESHYRNPFGVRESQTQEFMDAFLPHINNLAFRPTNCRSSVVVKWRFGVSRARVRRQIGLRFSARRARPITFENCKPQHPSRGYAIFPLRILESFMHSRSGTKKGLLHAAAHCRRYSHSTFRRAFGRMGRH